MKLLKIGECYLNLENVTHADFATTPQGLTCTVFFNCQTADGTGGNGIQASKTFSATEARTLKAWLDLRINSMEQQS
jgi:hypothetical protein